MDSSSNLLMNTSILYRSMQKYFDKRLQDYDIGAGQLLFLILIYENEGISMQNLAAMGSFDKGTITKGIAKLEELGFVTVSLHKDDKRVRLLYTSDKTKEVISDVYLLRREWWERITQGMRVEDIVQFEMLQAQLAKNARTYAEDEVAHIRVFGLQKLSLLDYPGKMASTLFTGGCNFRCPFCHNKDLVFLPENMTEMKEEDIFSYLHKRKGLLEGVCVSGGEPLLQEGIEDYLSKIKDMGYLIKLDTNGSNPEKLKELVEMGLLDYVAMDVKNAPDAYGKTIGIEQYDITPIRESVSYLLENHVPYEFRTTIVKEYHSEETIHALGKWLKGAKACYLQNFEDSDRVIQSGLHAHEVTTLESFKEIMKQYVENTQIRGL